MTEEEEKLIQNAIELVSKANKKVIEVQEEIIKLHKENNEILQAILKNEDYKLLVNEVIKIQEKYKS